MIAYEDFKKLKIKTARVLDAREHPSADRLYVLDIDIGTENRQIVAGIRGHYSSQELIGKNIAVVINLEPVTIRGIESNGMLLAASGGDVLSVLVPDRDVPPGLEIR
jgi:methionine--tRNA ligase beta chain